MFDVAIFGVAVAVGSDDGDVVIRVVNFGASTTVTLELEAALAPNVVLVGVLQGETGDDLEQNTPDQPTRISPKYSPQAYTPSTPYTLPANSFTIFTFSNVTPA